MAHLKAVLFDYDDTLVDSFPARVIAARRAVDGILDSSLDIDSIMREWAGMPQIEIWRHLARDEGDAGRLQEAYASAYWDDTTKTVRAFDGVVATMQGLKRQGLTLAIVTSKARLREHRGRPIGALVEMKRVGLDGIFDLIVGHEDVQESKPSPAPILFALERLGLEATDALMVGDSHVDIEAAKAAGVSSVGATWGTVSEELLVKAGPDFLAHSPAEIPGLVSRGARQPEPWPARGRLPMPSEVVSVQTDGRVATVAVGAAKAPADHRTFEFRSACERLRQDDAVWVVVLTGKGEVFVQGAELSPRATRAAVPVAGMASAVADIEKPVIAAINGDAIDQGLELALACDIRVASDRARFGLTQVEAGLTPRDGGTQRLPRLIGRARALEMILSSRLIDAAEAKHIGVVSDVVAPSEVLARAQEIASAIAKHGPIASRYLKEAVLQGLDMTLGQGLRLEADLSFLLQSTADRAEGIDSFLERREPGYRGE